KAVTQRGGIDLHGAVTGFGTVESAGSDVREAITGADVIMVVTPSSAHRFMAEACAPHLRDGQIVILNPGRTFGAFEFKRVLTKCGCTADVIVGETQTFI